MRLLAFDCSGPWVAAALLRGAHPVARCVPMQRGQAERLMPLLEELLHGQGLGWRDLDGIGVGVGPGNFTGIRIAVAAARGLALGLGVPVAGVSGFEARGFGTMAAQTIHVSGRGQDYAQDFSEGRALGPPRLVTSHPDRAEMPVPIEALALCAAQKLGAGQVGRPAPLYVRTADAAPASEAPPQIVP